MKPWLRWAILLGNLLVAIVAVWYAQKVGNEVEETRLHYQANYIETVENFWEQQKQLGEVYQLLRDCQGLPVDTGFVNGQERLRVQGLALLSQQREAWE